MFGLFKKSSTEKNDSAVAPGLFSQLKERLTRTRTQLVAGVSALFLGKKTIDADLFEALETQLLLADLGAVATQKIIAELTAQTARRELNDSAALLASLKAQLHAILAPVNKPLIIDAQKKPFVILMVGVNGAGKTTSIGKLATQFQQQGKSVLLAAGDTFRAAAVEQLTIWGERNQVDVIAQTSGADSAAVIYDAIQAAKARHIDIVIADTAGRLHTQQHLMQELQKVVRVIQKMDATAPHEVLLVLDATIGQNALIQAQQFYQAVKVSGIVLTKLDGTAKGGIIFAIAEQLKLPIRYIGVGETLHDLKPFVAEEFIDALFE